MQISPSFSPRGGAGVPIPTPASFFAKPDGFGRDGFDGAAVARMGGASAATGFAAVARTASSSARVVVQETLATRLVGRAYWLAAPIAAVTNWLDYNAGRITAEQRNTLIAADAVGYTAAGFAGTTVTALLGATGAPGLLVGLAVGGAAAWAYERFARPRFDPPVVTPYPPPK